MPHLLIAVLIVAGILAAVVTLVMARQRKAGADSADGDGDGDSPAKPDVTGYVKRPYLFTSSEYAFYKVLHAAVGDRFTVLVKVRIADLIDVERGAAKRQAKLNRIMKKHVDFVLCDPRSMVPALAVELDDRSHEAEDRRERDALVDAIFGAVGMPCLHVPVAKSYEAASLLAQIDRATGR